MSDSAPVHAPEFPVDATWNNADRPLRLHEDLRGHVVVLDFWTYCCINCLHTLPVLSRLEQEFDEQPVAVIGVHSAKFVTERDPRHIAMAVQRYHVQHPVVVDSEHDVWQSFAVKAWPTVLLVDAEGRVRDELRGEPDFVDLHGRVQALLTEAREKGIVSDRPVDLRPDPTLDEQFLAFPGKVAADDERIYVADSAHHRVIVTDHEGRVRTVVGGVRGVGNVDGRHDTAAFNDPQGMDVVDGTLYVADRGNHLLRAVDLDLMWVRTVAGTGEKGMNRGALDPSKPLEVGLRSPWDVQTVGHHLLIAMAGSHQIWLYDTESQQVGAWAGSGVENHVDGPLHEAALAQPSGLALLGQWLIVADSEVSSVRAIDLHENKVETVVGKGLFDFGDVDGAAADVLLQHPLDVAAIGETLYVADTYNHKIKAVDLRAMEVRTVFGTGDPDVMNEPGGLCAVGERLLVADTNNHRLLWADPRDGSVTPFEPVVAQ